MKLLVSDYDGTLNPYIGDIQSNLNEIKKFCDRGNIFMISTGRSFESIKKEINKHNIKYDYLSCNDGSVLFDKYDNLLYVQYLNIKLLNKLVEDINSIDIIKKYNKYGIYGKIENGDTVELELKVPFLNIKPAIELLEEYPCFAHDIYPGRIYIKKHGGKSKTINYLLKKHNIQDVYTVGDSTNDIEMLREFKGFKMYTGTINLIKNDIKPIISVKSLVKKINRGVI